MGCEPSRDHIDWGPLKGSTGGRGLFTSRFPPLEEHHQTPGAPHRGPLRPVVTKAELLFFKIFKKV